MCRELDKPSAERSLESGRGDARKLSPDPAPITEPGETASAHLATMPEAPTAAGDPNFAEVARTQAATPCTTFPGRSWHRSHHAARFTFSRLARAARLPASSFAAIASPFPK